jgi:hypothetical protein
VPADFRDRAHVRQWLSWQGAHLFMPLESAFLCKFLAAIQKLRFVNVLNSGRPAASSERCIASRALERPVV